MEKQSDEEGWWRFLNMCQQVESAADFDAIFHVFLTFEEREALAKRYWILRELLKEERTQREISAKFKVSIAKITRGSNELKQTDEKVKAMLRELMT